MNAEIIERAIVLAKAHPELHDQSDYAYYSPCGTVMCIAGWIAVADRFKVDEEGFVYKPGSALSGDHVCNVAPKIAGLDSSTEYELFIDSSDDDMPALERRWARIKEEAEA